MRVFASCIIAASAIKLTAGVRGIGGIRPRSLQGGEADGTKYRKVWRRVLG